MRPGNKVLQKQLDDWVENFEEAEERKGKEKKASMADDGWTVVVRAKVSRYLLQDRLIISYSLVFLKLAIIMLPVPADTELRLKTLPLP